MRPALRREWASAIAAFDTLEYVNELGVAARADLLDDVVGDLGRVGMALVDWYSVRVFNDDLAPDAPAPDDLELLLHAEDLAGRRDPYRWLGAQIQVVAAHATPERDGGTR